MVFPYMVFGLKRLATAQCLSNHDSLITMGVNFVPVLSVAIANKISGSDSLVQAPHSSRPFPPHVLARETEFSL